MHALAATAGPVDAGVANTGRAMSLLSGTPVANASGPSPGNAFGGGGSADSGSSFGTLKTSPNLDPTSATDPGTSDGGAAGLYSASGGAGTGSAAGGAGTDGSAGNRNLAAIDPSSIPRNLDFGDGQSQRSENADPTGRGGVGEFNSDNSETWTPEEKARRLKEALEMDPDLYFKLIPKNDSIFRIVHLRIEKIQKRWPAPNAPTVPKEKATHPKLMSAS